MTTKKDDDRTTPVSQSGMAPHNDPNRPGGDPVHGTREPGRTVESNPARTSMPVEPSPPTEDPMATPEASPTPNPPSAPGGDMTGGPADENEKVGTFIPDRSPRATSDDDDDDDSNTKREEKGKAKK